MSAILRYLLPTATALAATLYLAAAVPHQVDLELAAAQVESPEQAEVAGCVANGRDADACLDEVDAKALLERADGDARRGRRP